MTVTLKLKLEDKRRSEKITISDTKHIILRDRGIKWIDLSPLEDCKDLVELELHQNAFETIDLTPLSSCTDLSYLSLSTNNLYEIDLAPLSSCESLNELVIHRNGLTEIDLSPLSSCKNLYKLGLGENALTSIDLSPLSSCTELRELWLRTNQLESIDLSPLASCTKLEALYLPENQLRAIDLSPLSNCPQLETLEIASNNLTSIDLKPLQNAKNLQRLVLYSNEITSIDLSPLFHCTALEILYFKHNHFQNVDPTPLALMEELECESFEGHFSTDSSHLRRINILFSKENFWKLCYDERKKVHYDVPVFLNDIEIISGIYKRVVETEPLWKQIHLLQNALTLTGFGWCGIVDSDPQPLLHDVFSSPESPPVLEKLVSLISEQIDRNGTTIGLDMDKIKEYSDLAKRVDDVHEIRKQEMETVEIGTVDSMFDLRSLLLTAHGNQILTSLGYGVKCNEDGIAEIKSSISELGFELRTVDDITENQLTRFSPALTEYIWNLAEYNSILKRGTSRRLKRKTLRELGLIE
ncbi:MAG: leucine-rich repeat domain-containing protein [Candidatus Thorarchaeota archaeon]